MKDRDEKGRFIKGIKYQLGYRHTEETKRKLKGNKNRLGIFHSEETKRKIGLAHKGMKRSKEAKRNMSEAHKGQHSSLKTEFKKGQSRKHSMETKKKISLSHKGNKSYLWKGGITPVTQKRLNSFEWHEIRKQVYKRDKYTCQICGIQYKDKNGKGMSAHHIIPYRINQDNNLGNLITLCQSCHIKEEYRYYHKIKNANNL